MSRALRVLLADDQALVRAGFRVLIESAPDMQVVAEAGDGGHAVALTREHRPDVVLMDLRMPDVDGITATRRITADPALADVRVVVLTTFDDDENVLRALRAGASGFLVKDVELPELLQAIRVVACGDAMLAPRVTRALIRAFTAGGPERPPAAAHATGGQPAAGTLTEREREVVILVAAGLANAEIAAELIISPLTVKTHVSRAMSKLTARDRAQLVAIAYTSGLAVAGGADG